MSQGIYGFDFGPSNGNWKGQILKLIIMICQKGQKNLIKKKKKKKKKKSKFIKLERIKEK